MQPHEPIASSALQTVSRRNSWLCNVRGFLYTVYMNTHTGSSTTHVTALAALYEPDNTAKGFNLTTIIYCLA